MQIVNPQQIVIIQVAITQGKWEHKRKNDLL